MQTLDSARSFFAEKGCAGKTLHVIAPRVGIAGQRIIQFSGSTQSIHESIAETAYPDHPFDQNLIVPIKQKDDFAIIEALAAYTCNTAAAARSKSSRIVPREP